MRAALAEARQEAPEADLRVLQCGYSKSGNYLTHRALSAVLESRGCFRSFVERSGVGAAIDALCPETRRMPDAHRIDNLKLVDGAWHIQFPDMRCRFLPVSWPLARDASTLVWSHDRPDLLEPWESDFSHRFYLLRDGRDVVNSMLHYLVTPAILRLYPDHRYENLEQIYADHDFFASKVRAWRDHVRAWWARADRYHLVRFEDLASDRNASIATIAQHLGIPGGAETAVAATDFEAMRHAAPRHVRRGQRGDWRGFFGAPHRSIFKEIAGEDLVRLGYETTSDW